MQTVPSAKLVNREPSGEGYGYHVSAEVVGYAPKRPEKDTPENVDEGGNGQPSAGVEGQMQGAPGHVPFGMQGGSPPVVWAPTSASVVAQNNEDPIVLCWYCARGVVTRPSKICPCL